MTFATVRCSGFATGGELAGRRSLGYVASMFATGVETDSLVTFLTVCTWLGE